MWPRPSRLLTAMLMVAGSSAMAVQSAEPWLPVTPQDLAVNAVPGNPGAPAIQLYYSYNKDDNDKFISVYRRIKILTDAGRKYGDVEIQLDPGESLKELRARTIHPDGSVVEFQGRPFEKTIAKTRGTRYVAKAFALSGVTNGSIVEYSYLISLPRHGLHAISQWFLQGDLYTLKERFRFRPFQGYVDVASEWNTAFRMSQVMCSYSNKVGAPSPQRQKDGRMELELENVAAAASEEYMPPKSDYQPFVMCYYGGREFISADRFWETWLKRITEFTEKWIGKPSAVRETALQSIGSAVSGEDKLRKLYARVQQVRNLSYEPERTQKEEERLKLKPNNEAKEVLQHGYGTHWEIDALLVDLARAAGFDASLLGVSDRHERSFNKLLLWLGQLDGVAAVVNLDGKDIILDPGTMFCPYGMLPWRYAGATALNYKSGGGFMTTSESSNSPAHRIAKVVVAPDGSAKGEISVELNGQEALEHRLEALRTDEAGRRKSFEDEIQAWLPGGAVVKMVHAQGWESTDAPLNANFTVEIPDFASLAGKRMLFPAYFLPTPFKSVFAHSSRSYPMDFPFAFTETDEVMIQVPTGYAVEAPPSPRKAGLPYASYEISSSFRDKQLVTTRSLRFDNISFPPEKYDELRNFFNVVHGGDTTQAVLRSETSAKTAKPE